jgi:chorismate dehydratase
MSSRTSPPVHLGAVEYLNARPLVYGLDRHEEFRLRFEVPSRCADLLHQGQIDLGLIPSIEYLRGSRRDAYRIVPDVAIGSEGPVASVVLYTTRAVGDVRSLALDMSSRSSVALVRVLCARSFRNSPSLVMSEPDLSAMLSRSDAALVIGDTALLLDGAALDRVGQDVAARRGEAASSVAIEPIDLGQLWTDMTGLPFVYAFWAGRAGALGGREVALLQSARDAGIAHISDVVRAYFSQTECQPLGERYLRDNIRYGLGERERAGLEMFYRYAAEAGLIDAAAPLRFFDADTD